MSAPHRRRRPPGDRGGGEGDALGGEQVEGRRAVRELLVAGRRRVRQVWLAEGTDPSPVLREIASVAAARRVALRTVSREQLGAVARTDSHQGVVARAEPVPEADLDELCQTTGPPPFLVGLDGVTDPHNLGAVLRTALGAGATGAVLPRHRAVHLTPAATKAAAGAVEHLPLAVVPGLPAALRVMRDHGVWTVGLDAAGRQSIYGLDLVTEPVVLVLGSEGTGLSRLVRERCDVVAVVPQHGPLGSLNVAAAAAVGCFEVARHRSGA